MNSKGNKGNKSIKKFEGRPSLEQNAENQRIEKCAKGKNMETISVHLHDWKESHRNNMLIQS